jgi:uncharacterized OB-fold protein
MDLLDLSNQGIILSYTLHHIPPDGFEAPLLLALVKLENNAVVLCNGDISDASRIKIDQTVSLGIDELGRLKLSLNE